MKTLTPKQLEILTFIEDFIEQHHYSPSYREIMHHFQLKSVGSVYKHIQTLKKKQCLTIDKHFHRSLKPMIAPQEKKEPCTMLELPLIGNISLGYPLELFIKPQMILVPPTLVQAIDHTYILQVQGDSLQEESIRDGDLILIESRQDIQPGEIILGIINQTDTILKRYYPEGLSIRLESQNVHVPSLTVRNEHILIQGALVGLIRMY